MLSALILTVTLAAGLEPVPPDAIRDGLLAVAPLYGSALCELPGGEIRLGILPQGSSPAKMSDADAARLLARAASHVPAGQTLTDKGWAREALHAGEAVRIWVAIKGPDGISVMHSIHLPGEPAIGFIFMSHSDRVAPPEALLALARSYTRGP